MLTTVTVDIGTTSVKLALFAPDGSVLAEARSATPTRHDGWGEVYDVPALTGLVTGFVQSLDAGLRVDVQRIAIGGVGESGGLVRSDLSLASPMILWHDHRGAAAIARLSDAERLRVYEVTGLPANANYGLSKTAWALEHADDAGDAQWLNVAEYLAATMTGERWSEYSLASRTMALDLRDGHWSAEICALFGVDPAVFPALRTARAGLPVSAEFAAAVGLPADTRVHVAGHDHMVGAIGAELAPGELLNSTGTTEGLLLLRDSPLVDAGTAAKKVANGISCIGTDFTLFASIPTGGSAFATLQTLLGASAEQVDGLVRDGYRHWVAGEVELDALPLVLPQFRGSPPPEKDASARGAISGLSSSTTAADVVLGCFLGMTLQFVEVLDLFGPRPQTVKVIGPASRNPLWLQLKADLLGSPLTVSAFPEVVSRGAQALASCEGGDWTAAGPHEIAFDADRHARLLDWRERIRPQWDHLKGLPRTERGGR